MEQTMCPNCDRKWHRQMVIRGVQCCGIYELEYLCDSTPLEAVKVYWRTVSKPKSSLGGVRETLGSSYAKPFILFSATCSELKRYKESYGNADKNPNYGDEFSKFLTDNNLGPVTVSEVRENWTGNMLKVYIWHPNYPEIHKFMTPHDEADWKKTEATRIEIERQLNEARIQSRSQTTNSTNSTGHI